MPASRIDRDEELHWLALRLIPGLGARRSRLLIERFRSPRTIFHASISELEASGLPGSIARSISSGCTFDDAALQHQKVMDTGTELVPLADPRYPPRLREICDPPPVLFVRGQVELLNSLMLGVVGTRRPTPYGRAVSERLSKDLAQAGLTIVSGMARGIDTAAHRGALEAGGNTIAVFGCGVDRVYPAENRRLASEISERGLLVSEFPMETPGQPQNFPVRNRIISGMSLGVLVVEGAQYSGSAITAKLAMEQGRDVFAVPGNITSRMSWGPNLLIKQGAKLIQEWNDVVVEIPPAERRRLIEKSKTRILTEENSSKTGTSGPKQASLPMGPEAQLSREVLSFLAADRAVQVDEVLEKLEDYSSSEVMAALFELEMLGLVRQLPGKNFVKVW